MIFSTSAMAQIFVKNGNGTESSPANLCIMATSGSSPNELCGAAIRGQVEYYLVNNEEGYLELVLWTPPNGPSDNCWLNGDQLICYAGIKIDLSNASVSVGRDRLAGIPGGAWTLYARIKGDATERVNITSFEVMSPVRMVWGTLFNELNHKIITDICKNPATTFLGALVPVCFAVGEATANGFEVNEDGAGCVFKLNSNGFANEFGNFDEENGLKVYQDPMSRSPVNLQAQTIPSNGVLVLWVTGDSKQESEIWSYKINVLSRPTSEEVTVWFQQTPTPINQQSFSANAMQLIKNGVSLQVAKNTSLEIFSLKGKLIRKMNFASGVYSVELSDLPKGMYIARAKFGNSQMETLKIPVM